jgi:hypothetical protein
MNCAFVQKVASSKPIYKENLATVWVDSNLSRGFTIIFPEKDAVADDDPFTELQVRQNKRKQKLKNVSGESSREVTCVTNLSHFLALSLKEFFMSPSSCLTATPRPSLLACSNRRSASIMALLCCPWPYITNSDVRPSLQRNFVYKYQISKRVTK